MSLYRPNCASESIRLCWGCGHKAELILLTRRLSVMTLMKHPRPETVSDCAATHTHLHSLSLSSSSSFKRPWLSSSVIAGERTTKMAQRAHQRRKRAVGGNQQVRAHPEAYPRRRLQLQPRYCLQATATEGLAAYFDSKNCPTHSPHHWSHLCAHRRSPDMG